MKRLILLAGVVLGLLSSQNAQAASAATTWYWTENTMIGELRQDYSYDPDSGIPNDPWHYELNTVECRGYGRFIGRQGERYSRRFVCTLTYVATDPAVPNYVDRTDARVTGRYDYQEYKPPTSVPPTQPTDRSKRVLIGYRGWSRVDDRSPSWLVKPRSLLLLGRFGVLADSPMIWRVKWRSWGGARAAGIGRSRTKVYDPWSRVRLVAHRVRICGDTKSYTRVTALFAQTYGTHTHTWSMQPCGIRLR
jgi:hypothetical protein